MERWGAAYLTATLCVAMIFHVRFDELDDVVRGEDVEESVASQQQELVFLANRRYLSADEIKQQRPRLRYAMLTSTSGSAMIKG
jgi:hypothetical protein